MFRGILARLKEVVGSAANDVRKVMKQTICSDMLRAGRKLQYAFDGEPRVGDGVDDDSPMYGLVYEARDKLEAKVKQLESAYDTVVRVLG